MPYFLTEYKTGAGVVLNAELRARSARDATRVALKRGIGESVLGGSSSKPWIVVGRASEVFASHDYSELQKIHALCWLAYLAMSSGAATAREVFDDHSGFLHQAAHYLQGDVWFTGGRRAYKRHVLSLIRRVERRVPGLP